MVYRALGVTASQRTIWNLRATDDGQGGRFIKCNSMVLDAIDRGLSAVAFKALDPLHSLQTCMDASIYAILLHSNVAGSNDGHCTVLVDVDEGEVIVHDPDPEYGRDRRVTDEELLELWQSRPPEIMGHILIAIGQMEEGEVQCSTCGRQVQEQFPCPGCGFDMLSRPGLALGCINSDCDSRTWEYFVCPGCDRALIPKTQSS